MKKIVVGLLSVVCLSNIAFAQYMSKEEVLKEYQKKEIRESVFKPSAQYKSNMEKLIPANTFKPKTEAPKGVFQKEMKDAPILDTVDLRSRDTEIKNQGNYGYCTAYSLIAIIENIINKDGNKTGLDLSEWHAWSLYKVYQMDAAINALNKNKICDETDFKTGGKITAACTKKAHATVTSFKQINQEQVTQTLSNGLPVYFGVSVPRGMANCEKVIKDETVTSGGHAVEIAGYTTDKTTGEILYYIKNSWGKGCGDQGFMYLRQDYCKKTWCYFYEVSSVASKYDSVIPPTPVPDKVCTKWKTIWYMPWKSKCVLWQ